MSKYGAPDPDTNIGAQGAATAGGIQDPGELHPAHQAGGIPRLRHRTGPVRREPSLIMTTDTRDPAQDAHDAEHALAALYQSSTDEAMAGAADALARAIRACPDADALERLLARPPIADLFGNGLGSLPLWPPVIDAMVSLAEALPQASDAARALGWARWSCAAPPVQLVRPDVVPSLVPAHREACLPAFEARAPLYRRWLGDGTAERRAAGAHALAWCRSAMPSDTGLVLTSATTEPDGAALGSALLTLGVLVHRAGADADVDAAARAAHRQAHPRRDPSHQRVRRGGPRADEGNALGRGDERAHRRWCSTRCRSPSAGAGGLPQRSPLPEQRPRLCRAQLGTHPRRRRCSPRPRPRSETAHRPGRRSAASRVHPARTSAKRRGATPPA